MNKGYLINMEHALSINFKIDWEFTEAEPTAHDSSGYDAHISIIGVKALIGDGEYELPNELEEKVIEELEADEDLKDKLWEEHSNQTRRHEDG